eukprot:TRINITY_DN4104_c1_g1_i1.p1 TRINITY_DN4104_c1_g1~~TRINITY_DN4104_c1_g1_i1.p1  ORF type:complete len:644 (+),score=201.25 TRINITY_DN4104_c1_g1_i1:1082-3013(+)
MMLRVLALFALVGVLEAAPGGKKIKHVVVLMEENRSFDHIFGWRKGVNGLTGNEYNLLDSTNPNSEKIYVSKNGTQITKCDPYHSTPTTTDKIFTKREVARNNLTVATMGGFVETEGAAYQKDQFCEVMDMQVPENVPVISALADEFVLMDRFFCSVPGPTWPNRMYMLAATSLGSTETGPWYHNQPGQLFNQKTFFDQVAEQGGTWRNYYNDTPWELFMGVIAKNPENTQSMDQFFIDAREGNLPTFSWINPRSGINLTQGVGSNDQHPDHDMAAGEAFYKDVYEALRASPQWNETLYIITYDEHGGFYDHVPTPLSCPHPGDNEPSYPDSFGFDRIGVRIPTLLISPWLPKGLVLSGPPDAQKPFNDSEYELTSIMATSRKLLDMDTTPLTKRDAWAATFEHIFLDTPRQDCPMHLPDAIPPQKDHLEVEAELEINQLQSHIMTVHAHIAGVEWPHHVTAQKHVSEWVQTHYQKHRETHKRWQDGKAAASYKVVVQPSELSAVTGTWTVNQGTNTSMNVISCSISSTAYCLDGGSMTLGAAITVTPCLPGTNPDTNRDPSQQWILRNDATIRPFKDQTLCLDQAPQQIGTYAGSRDTLLALCTGSVSQHYGYHGSAPGNPFTGDLFFGDDANSLTVNATNA